MADAYSVSASAIISIRGKGLKPDSAKIPRDKAQYILDNPHVPNSKLREVTGVSIASVSRIKNQLTYPDLTSNATDKQWEEYRNRTRKFKSHKKET